MYRDRGRERGGDLQPLHRLLEPGLLRTVLPDVLGSDVGQACGYFESSFVEVQHFTADVAGVTHSCFAEIL